jgi:hypothetical protein
MHDQLRKDRRNRFRAGGLRRLNPVTLGDEFAGYGINNGTFNA